MNPIENEARLEDFPMIDRPRVCRRCNFRRLCFPRAGEGAQAGPPGTVEDDGLHEPSGGDQTGLRPAALAQNTSPCR